VKALNGQPFGRNTQRSALSVQRSAFSFLGESFERAAVWEKYSAFGSQRSAFSYTT